MADITSNGHAANPQHRPATFLRSEQAPAGPIAMGQRNEQTNKVEWMLPNWGVYPVSHITSFQSILTSGARVYRQYDEALKDNLDNARFMRNDCGIMECIEARQRCVSLLNWHLEPENDKSHEQKALCEELTKIVKRIRRFEEYQTNLLHAVWFGKYGIQHTYGWQNIGGKMRLMPTGEKEGDIGWSPVHGDKLCFRFDDGSLKEGQYDGQVGVRVGTSYISAKLLKDRSKIEVTDRGMAYFLDEDERRMFAIHKHMIEDGEFEDAISAGKIHGVGIRSRIYWEWVQKQETMGFLMEYLERSAGGIQLWMYPSGNETAKAETEKAVQRFQGGSRNVVMVPVPAGDDGHQYGVQVIEPGMAGIEMLKDLIGNHFGHRMKRYILGQVLTSEAEATGLGSGVADAHMDTLNHIIKYDAINVEETITFELIQRLKEWNFPAARNIHVRFVKDTETDDAKEKLETYQIAYQMGASIPENAVMDQIGLAMAGPNERVLSMQAQQEQQAKMQQAMQPQMPPGGAIGSGGVHGIGMPPMPGQDDGEPPAGPSDDDGGPMPPDPDRGGDSQQYARKPAKGQSELFNPRAQGEFEWVTIGGHPDDKGHEHAGGTPVKIEKTTGKIAAGPDALEGKTIDQLKSEGSDKPAEAAPKRKKPHELFDEHFDAARQPKKHYWDERREKQQQLANQPADETPAPVPEEQTLADSPRITQLLDASKKYSTPGEIYRRDIAAPRNRLIDAIQRGHTGKMLDHLAGELEMRMDVHAKGWKDKLPAADPSEVEAAPTEQQPAKQPLIDFLQSTMDSRGMFVDADGNNRGGDWFRGELEKRGDSIEEQREAIRWLRTHGTPAQQRWQLGEFPYALRSATGHTAEDDRPYPAEAATQEQPTTAKRDPAIEKQLAAKLKNKWYGQPQYKDIPGAESMTDGELRKKLDSIAKGRKELNDWSESDKAEWAGHYRESLRRQIKAKSQQTSQYADQYRQLEQAGQWPNGLKFPQHGEKVEAIMPGLFGMASKVEGIAKRRDDGTYFVEITSADAGGAKRVGLTSDWTVPGDPALARLQEEGRKKESEKAAANKAASDASQATHRQHLEAWKSSGGELNPTDIKPGDKLQTPAFAMEHPDDAHQHTVAEVTPDGDVYGHSEGDDPSHAPGFIGTIGKHNMKRIPGDATEKAGSAPGMTYEQFADEYRKAFAQANKYGPNAVGGTEATDRMAELAEQHPEWAERAENEGGPANTPAEAASDNPFRQQADELQKRIDRLTGGSSHDEAMRKAFPLGTGRPGNASSRATSKRSDQRIDRTIDDAKKATKLIGQRNALQTQAEAFEAGRIDERGNPTAAVIAERESKAKKLAEGKQSLSDFYRATIKPGDQVHLADNPNNAVTVKRVNPTGITSDSGTKWSYDEILPRHPEGRAMTAAETITALKSWKESENSDAANSQGEPWQETQEQRLERERGIFDNRPVTPRTIQQDYPENTWKTQHKRDVENALAAGKSVPTEVLADYPELQEPPAEKPKNSLDMIKDILGDKFKTSEPQTADERELEKLEQKRVDLNKQGAKSRGNIVAKQRERADLDEKIQRLREKLKAAKPAGQQPTQAEGGEFSTNPDSATKAIGVPESESSAEVAPERSQIAPPAAAKPGSNLTGWHKDEFDQMATAMTRQVGNETNVRRQLNAATGLMEGSPPDVQNALMDHLKEISPDAHAELMKKPPMFLANTIRERQQAEQQQQADPGAMEDRVLSHLAGQQGPVKMRDLQQALAPGVNYNRQDPLSHPVNAALRKLNDQGRINTHDSGWGEPSFSHKGESANATVQTAKTEAAQPDEQVAGPGSDNSGDDPGREPTKAAADLPAAGIDRAAAIHDRIDSGQATAEDVRNWHKEMQSPEFKASITADLNKKSVAELKKMGASGYYGREKKADLVEQLADRITSGEDFARLHGDGGLSFTIGGNFRQSRDQAIAKKLEGLTDEHLKSHADKVKAQRDERAAKIAQMKQGMDNPQTAEDFERIKRVKGSLTPEQEAAYDELQATTRRAKDREKAATVKGFSGGEEKTGGIGIVKGRHQKRGVDTHTVTVENRLGSEGFQEALRRAKQLGGSYVNAMVAKRYGATAGFQFFDEDSANKFASVLRGESADRSENLEQREADRQAGRAESLAGRAEAIGQRADEQLGQERKTNTARRADMAASANARARAQQADAKTLGAIASKMQSGELKHLNGVKAMTHMDTLNSILRRGQYDRFREHSKQPGAMQYEDFMAQPQTAEDAAAAKYPYPSMWASDLKQHAKEFADVPGLKRIAQSLAKSATVEPKFATSVGGFKASKGRIVTPEQVEAEAGRKLQGIPEGKHFRVHASYDWRLGKAAGGDHKLPLYTADKGKTWGTTPITAVAGAYNKNSDIDYVDAPEDQRVTFDQPEDIAKLATAANRLRRSSNSKHRQIGERLADELQQYNRLQSMDIKSPAELRAALREYLPLKTGIEKEDPVKAKERALIGQKIPGFFPTPRPLIDRMLDAAQIESGHDVLEPSAGKGDILDAVRERHPDAQTTGIEPVHSLRDIIGAKGHNLAESRDFLQHQGQHDRIVMNPPFENGQDIDHVRHAYEQLKPGGRLVAVMSEGPFGRSDKKAQEFRDWIDSIGGEHEPLPEGSFMGNDAFRQTGVRTRLVTIDKPGA